MKISIRSERFRFSLRVHKFSLFNRSLSGKCRNPGIILRVGQLLHACYCFLLISRCVSRQQRQVKTAASSDTVAAVASTEYSSTTAGQVNQWPCAAGRSELPTPTCPQVAHYRCESPPAWHPTTFSVSSSPTPVSPTTFAFNVGYKFQQSIDHVRSLKVLEKSWKMFSWSGKFYCIIGRLLIEFFTLTGATVNFSGWNIIVCWGKQYVALLCKALDVCTVD